MAERLPRNMTRIEIRPADITDAAVDRSALALAVTHAVRDAIRDPDAWPAVDEMFIVVDQPFVTWHAETPPQLAELLDADDTAKARRLARAGKLVFDLEWREGDAPEDGDA